MCEVYSKRKNNLMIYDEKHEECKKGNILNTFRQADNEFS